MALDSQNLIDRLASHAMTLGYFDRVNSHEPKNKPARGMTCAIWVDRIEPARGMSGLNVTTARVTFNVRLYSNMLQEPQDMIDPNLMIACDELMNAYTGDFTLGGTIKQIDLLGASQGHPLFMQSGYINIDNVVFRVLTLTVPCIVNDAWNQEG